MRIFHSFKTLILFITFLTCSFSAASNSDVEKCKDLWNVDSQWQEMKTTCYKGANSGDPVSQVAVAIKLLESSDANHIKKAKSLLSSAASQGYDDSFYWLGVMTEEKDKDVVQALAYLEMAEGTGGYGLLALVVAADIHFKGHGVEKNFDQARKIFGKAIHQVANNKNIGIPEPPGEWWSNKKWFNAHSAILLYAPRYGFRINFENNKYGVVDLEPQPSLSDKDLYNLRRK